MTEEFESIKVRIAELYAQRERLKSAIENKSMVPHHGLKQLFNLDAELSLLDSRFKQLWDSQHQKT